MSSSVPIAILRTSVWEGLVGALTYGGYGGMEDYPLLQHFALHASLMLHLLMHCTLTEQWLIRSFLTSL